VGDALEQFTLIQEDIPHLDSAPHLMYHISSLPPTMAHYYLVVRVLTFVIRRHEDHPLELLMERWVAFFKWSYAPLPSYETKEAVRNQLRYAVEDVNSFIDYLVQEVRFADNCAQHRHLLRKFVGRYILTYTHSSIFTLYRRVVRCPVMSVALALRCVREQKSGINV
jgi:hypothetical protein